MRLTPLSLRLALALVASFFALTQSEAAFADRWLPPSTQTTVSPSGEYRFTVEPKPNSSFADYIDDEVQSEIEGKLVDRPVPKGLLEKRDADGAWRQVWAGPLVNRVAPASVLVADNGRYVVTFDNWGSTGLGDHVVVIYGPGGKVMRSMAPAELVPQDYISSFTRTNNSLAWKRDAEILASSEELAIDVITGHAVTGDIGESFRLLIKLSDGTIKQAETIDL